MKTIRRPRGFIDRWLMIAAITGSASAADDEAILARPRMRMARWHRVLMYFWLKRQRATT